MPLLSNCTQQSGFLTLLSICASSKENPDSIGCDYISDAEQPAYLHRKIIDLVTQSLEIIMGLNATKSVFGVSNKARLKQSSGFQTKHTEIQTSLLIYRD